MKGNSNIQPERLTRFSEREWQIKWNITRNDKTDEEGNIIESWDYEYANCKSPERSDIIEGIIRSRYSQSEVEAILSNYLGGEDDGEYSEFQKWRRVAKAVADETEIPENVVINDRIGDVEQTTLEIIESLNEKNILP